MSVGGEAGAVAAGSAAWWQEQADREVRRRPRTDGLTRARIVVATLEVVDREGLDALTVRRLAQHLGTGSASLYRHVASREELLVHAADHVIGEVRFPDPALPARRRVEHLAVELRRVLMGHPNLVPALTASPLLGPNASQGAERGLSDLLDVGFEPSVAVPAYLALIDYVLGTVFFDTSSAGRMLATEPHEAEIAALGPFTVPTVDDVFQFGLTTFLDGLEARFPPPPSP